MPQDKQTPQSDEDLSEDAVDPDNLEPTDEEVTEEHATAESLTTKETGDTLSTSLVPVTTIQQYLTELRRYPYLSKEEELRLFEEYQQGGYLRL